MSQWKRAESPCPVYDITTEEDHKHEDLDQGIGEQRLIDGLRRTSTGISRKNQLWLEENMRAALEEFDSCMSMLNSTSAHGIPYSAFRK